MQNVKVVRSMRTLSIMCRTDVMRRLERNGGVVSADPWTAEPIYLATGYPPVPRTV